MSHEGENARSILFCEECEEKLALKEKEQIRAMINAAQSAKE